MYSFKKSLIALGCLVVLVSVFVALMPIVSQGQGKKESGPRKYYLTQTPHQGHEALTACAEGYHMASLWEILDPSNLRYDTELGLTLADSGFGPPAGAAGWVRTGTSASGLNAAGRGNCEGWAPSHVLGWGTVVSLSVSWKTTTTSRINPWVADTQECVVFVPPRVWCVQD